MSASPETTKRSRGKSGSDADPPQVAKKVMLVSLLIAAALIAVLTFIGWQYQVIAERNHQLQTFAMQHAHRAVANVSNYTDSLKRRLNLFADSRSLRNALMAPDDEALEQAGQSFLRSMPPDTRVDIFRLNEASIDASGSTPLRFSELDLIRRAERREDILPEAFEVDQVWYISLVAHVMDDALAGVLGTVLVTVPMAEMQNSLQEKVTDYGKVALFQSFDGRVRQIAQFGQGSVFTAPSVAIPGTPWAVEFVASERLLDQTRVEYMMLTVFWVIGAVAILAVCLLAGLMIGRRLQDRTELMIANRQRMGQVATAANGGASPAKTMDILDIQILEEDQGLLGLEEIESPAPAVPVTANVDRVSEAQLKASKDVPDHIFRSYDIRGLADTEISRSLAHKIGQALGSEALEQKETALIVARDARTHSPLLTENLIRGILSTGCNVLNIGTVPTPLLYFATEILEQSRSGVMVTASHNKAQYNGFKLVMNRQSRTEKDIKAVRTRILKGQFKKGAGQESHLDVVSQYIETIFSDIALAGDVRLVIDAANGVAGKVAPQLFSELGCEVIPLYCDLDGSFPHHDPDPSVAANLQDLIVKVRETGAHLGVAFDGDGDRLAVVTPQGQIIWPDRLLMLLARDILARNPGGDVVFDVKSSRLLNTVVSESGGRPIMWKTGHAPMRAKVLETGALIGGEYSGHIFIKDRWYGFDDGLYAAARVIEIISLRDEGIDAVFAEFPMLPTTPEIRVDVAEERKFQVIEQLVQEGEFDNARLTTIDGLRAEFPFGWGLVRASNTSAELTLRFEAETEEQLHQLKALFTREIRKIDQSIRFNW